MVLMFVIAERKESYYGLDADEDLTNKVDTSFLFSSSSSSSSTIWLKFGLCLTARGNPFPPPYERKSPGTTNFLFRKNKTK